MLSDADIHDRVQHKMLGIDPFDLNALQPASYDLTLDRHVLLPRGDITTIDLADVPKDHMFPETVGPEGIILSPGDFILGCTRETITIGGRYVGRVEGKSSLGRLGLMVHITAGFIDPGFTGQITLEIVNVAPWELVLYPGQRIAQIAFSQMTTWPMREYGHAGNHYQSQVGPTESRFEMAKPETLPGLETPADDQPSLPSGS